MKIYDVFGEEKLLFFNNVPTMSYKYSDKEKTIWTFYYIPYVLQIVNYHDEDRYDAIIDSSQHTDIILSFERDDENNPYRFFAFETETQPVYDLDDAKDKSYFWYRAYHGMKLFTGIIDEFFHGKDISREYNEYMHVPFSQEKEHFINHN